ncbi:MAG: hypothetical protein U0228_06260 [Myxococcaceae bacterium]
MTSALLALALLAAPVSSPPTDTPPAATDSGAPGPFAARALIPLTVGAGLLAGGIVSLVASAVLTGDALKLDPGEAQEKMLFEARGDRVAGIMLSVGAGLMGIISAIVLQYQPASPVQVGFAPTSGGAFVSLGWSWR